MFLTGLSGAGRSTIADASVADLGADRRPVTVLDGDVVRTRLPSELTPYALPARAEVTIDTSVTADRTVAASTRPWSTTANCELTHAAAGRGMWHPGLMADRDLMLVARLHIDLALVSSAVCHAAR